MPRRLGDDPLTRARNGAARAVIAADALASAPVAPDSGIPSRRSYNDVFFQRRAEENNPVMTSEPQQEVAEIPKTREISEISEIPEIRDVAAVPMVQTDRDEAAIVEVSQVPEVAQDVEVPPVSVVASTERVALVESGAPAAEPVAQVDAVPEAKEEPMGLSSASHAPNQNEDQPEPEKNGGFLKRLFSRFGK